MRIPKKRLAAFLLTALFTTALPVFAEEADAPGNALESGLSAIEDAMNIQTNTPATEFMDIFRSGSSADTVWHTPTAPGEFRIIRAVPCSKSCQRLRATTPC